LTVFIDYLKQQFRFEAEDTFNILAIIAAHMSMTLTLRTFIVKRCTVVLSSRGLTYIQKDLVCTYIYIGPSA